MPATKDRQLSRNETLTVIDEREASRKQNEFDFGRSSCIVPARTSVHAYVDDHGDLWLHTSDSALQVDTELRIAADDVADLSTGLPKWWGGRGWAKPSPRRRLHPMSSRRSIGV